MLRMTLQLHPGAAELHTLLGNALESAGDAGAAIAAHREALRLEPRFFQAWANLANAHLAAGDPNAALAALDEALTLRPDEPELLHNLSVALLTLRRWADAADASRRCLALAPGHARAHANLGLALKEQDRLVEAEAALRLAVAHAPLDPDAHWNLALLLLAEGRHAEGFAEYEWRRRIPSLRIRRFPVPEWDGAPHPLNPRSGETLLLHTEQGIGDTLQFIRFAPLARRRVARVLLACPPALRPLLEGCPGVDEIVDDAASLPPFTRHAPLLSLPHLLKISAADWHPRPSSSSGDSAAYLHLDRIAVEKWQRRFHSRAGLNVGIAWQGNPGYRADQHRSLPLCALLPLTAPNGEPDGGVKFFSLQKHYGHEQLTRLDPRPPIADLAPELDNDGAAFVDTAAVLVALDLLICSDSAIAHLAGALGVEVWLLLAHRPDWRWGNHGESTPWYPRARLFRQSTPGDWRGVVERVAAALRDRRGQLNNSLEQQRAT